MVLVESCQPDVIMVSRGMRGDLLCLVVEATDVVPVVSVVAEFAVSPALVDGGPSHDTRVVDVSFDGFSPLLVEAVGHLAAEVIRARHLTPDEETKAVGPVVESRVFDFLVLTATIESHCFGQLDVRLQRVGARWRYERRWPVALIEQEGLEVRVTIQAQSPVTIVPADLTHSGGCLDFVDLLIAFIK